MAVPMPELQHPVRLRSLRDPERRSRFVLEHVLELWRAWETENRLGNEHEGMLKALCLVSRELSFYALPLVFRVLKPISTKGFMANEVVQKLVSGSWKNARHIRRVVILVDDSDVRHMGDLDALMEKAYMVLPHLPNLEHFLLSREHSQTDAPNTEIEDIFSVDKLLGAIHHTPKLNVLQLLEGFRNRPSENALPTDVAFLKQGLPRIHNLFLGNVFPDDWVFPALIEVLADSLIYLKLELHIAEIGDNAIIPTTPQ